MKHYFVAATCWIDEEMISKKSTLFMPGISLTIVVCTSHAFQNNFEFKQRFVKYFKKSCALGSDQQYSIK